MESLSNRWRWLRFVVFVLTLVGIRGAHADARALGAYESQALDLALSGRRLEIDPAPEGKRIGRIIVHNHDVFGPDDGMLHLLNWFHRTTREYVIEREVLLRPGDMWDATIAQESRRYLSSDTFTSLVVVVPVKSPQPGVIDLLVVTRDMWSLRLNTNFEYQGGVLSLLQIQPSENNFIGRRKQLITVFDMGLGSTAVGPSYRDENVVGSRWTFGSDARLLMSRATGDLEGGSVGASAGLPLWSLARKWAVDFSAGYSSGVSRPGLTAGAGGPRLCVFSDPARPTFCDPDPSQGVFERYKSQSVSAGASVTRSVGEKVISRFTARYGFSDVHRELYEGDFDNFPQLRQPFIDLILPRTERMSSVSLSYSMFVPAFMIFRDVGTFDFPEDQTMGPSANASVGWAAPFLGSEHEFWNVSAGLGFSHEIGRRGYFTISGGAGARIESATLLDKQLNGGMGFVTPPVLHVRLVLRGGVSRLIDNKAVRFLSIGGDSGLRGYPINAFRGQTLVHSNVELRTAGLPILFTRIGLVVFWDMGDAAPDFDQLIMQHDFGAGARLVIPQLQRAVLRVDWAFATHDTLLSRAGWPGRISAGFSQAF